MRIRANQINPKLAGRKIRLAKKFPMWVDVNTPGHTAPLRQDRK